jgi:hypothetical protein
VRRDSTWDAWSRCGSCGRKFSLFPVSEEFRDGLAVASLAVAVVSWWFLFDLLAAR